MSIVMCIQHSYIPSKINILSCTYIYGHTYHTCIYKCTYIVVKQKVLIMASIVSLQPFYEVIIPPILYRQVKNQQRLSRLPLHFDHSSSPAMCISLEQFATQPSARKYFIIEHVYQWIQPVYYGHHWNKAKWPENRLFSFQAWTFTIKHTWDILRPFHT